ncbi:LysR family transcriptional regulator [Pantoea sp. RIT-PI-b]|uniref:LysR family transcriptional regulator n=1 Tax=Pantoea sp. RIT-PI-b TaxID=1681195 RepID=UPI0006A060BF|nr:LysR substrate-binding domain-containing protein [Pantoea sp. RIT-PI-b]KNC05778.1 LysR family transcriptional regulator [Pantoea sp. RIT-PI-b]
MDIKLLRSFALVAELQHIGQAAEKLHISASPLSRQIQQLEDELGVALFHREKKRLYLSAEGKQFLIEVKALLAHHDRLNGLGRSLRKGQSGRLDIGYVEAAIHSLLLPDSLTRLDCSSEVDIQLHALRSQPQIDALSNHALDLALVYAPPEANDLFAFQCVLSEPVVLAMPGKQAIEHPRPEQLDKKRWIADKQSLNTTASSRLMDICERAGFAPDVRLEVSGPLAALSCVEAGLGYTLIQRSLARLASPAVTIAELPWLGLNVTLYAVWRKNEAKPLVTRLLAALREHVAC